ncbi:MAG: hypothetical protein BMS9Abin05_1016 [Rhodothermia bacterium]|nr:MAG: hypothetical protein BMS9Abin05_1016 [Rhodothermia bacterium]
MPMEENAHLEDLAILFVGLAKGADGQFHYRELEIVTDLLRNKVTGDADDVIPALIDRVLQKFESSSLSWEGVVGNAVSRLDVLLSESEKRTTLTQLSQIGLADRKFLHAEAAFIQQVKESWGITLLEGQPGDWSILGEGGIQGESLQALAVLYLSISYLPDAKISLAERETMLAQLGQWIPDASVDEVELALRDAMALFITRSADDNVQAATETIRRLVPRHQVPVIYQDLQRISESDNILEVEERSWLEKIAAALGISSE